MKPQISIIIPTYNGAHKIGNTLQSLASQTWDIPEVDYEILVVIDGSKDNTMEILHNQEFINKSLQIIDQVNQGRAATRNRGAQEAQGELLVFFDDDIRPIPSCLKLHWLHHLNHPQSILVGSPLEEMRLMQTDIQKYRAYLSRKWVAPLAKNAEPLKADQLFLTAANFSIPKKIFNDLGGFDHRLSDAEDYDLAVQAHELGIPIYFNPEALGWHDDFITCSTYIRRGREYRKAHQALQKLKPELYQKYNVEAYAPAKGLKKAIYRFFSQKSWVKLIDQNFWLLWIPQKLRYKIYDLVITGLVAHFPEKKI
ncbi:MAG: glycosyltransferase [Microscillaceae bacterium]|nr:glycosyltransferase [Microscillaceae bacterium]